MNIITTKPHIIFLLSIPIVMLIGILSGDSAIDINVHDSYFVLGYLHLAIFISILFGIFGIGYWTVQKAKKKLSKSLNLIHIILNFGGTLLILILAQLYRNGIMNYEFNNNLTVILTLIGLAIIVGQVIFPINIIYALMKKKTIL